MPLLAEASVAVYDLKLGDIPTDSEEIGKLVRHPRTLPFLVPQQQRLELVKHLRRFPY